MWWLPVMHPGEFLVCGFEMFRLRAAASLVADGTVRRAFVYPDEGGAQAAGRPCRSAERAEEASRAVVSAVAPAL